MFNYLLVFLLLTANLAGASKADKIQPHSLSGIVQYKAQTTFYKLKSYTPTLKFTPQKSIFRWNLEKIGYSLKNDGNSTNEDKIVRKAYKDSIGRINFYNSVKDSLYSRKYIVNKIYLLKEKNPHIHWTITDTTQKIGDYTCTKAKAHFRGRDYTAWFTPDIPVPFGPWKLNGLPGLILKAYDTNRDIIFNVQKIKFSNTKNIASLPLNGTEKVISLDQYKEMINHLRQRLAKRDKKWPKNTCINTII